jgi:transaldolase
MVNQEIGFSLWLDFVERDFLKKEFKELIGNNIINGATSNPAIFASAITTSPAYKEQLKSLEGKSPKEKYEALAIEDIKTAAIALRECYDSGNDGYISIEVDPFLSNDTDATVAEGKRLFEAIGEPNVMIKVPATPAGYEAMTRLMSDGISVNATLIFSPAQAKECLKAMKKGIEASPKLPIAQSECDEYFEKLSANGVDMQEVYNKLLDDGLVAFEKAFSDMLETLK